MISISEKWVNVYLISLFFVACIACVSMPIYFGGHVLCSLEWSSSNMDYKYSMFKGCMVEHPEFGWIKDRYFKAYD